MRWDRPPQHESSVTLPAWVPGLADYEHHYETDEARMRLAIALARDNVRHGTGGPFGAAVFEQGSGRLVAVGVNAVVRLNNPTAHAEVVALQLAARRIGHFSLAGPGQPPHEIFTSCAPCAMCLGAVLWSGVRRLVTAAQREDAERIRFDEGPVFAESYAYLRARGIATEDGLLRDEARAVLDAYAAGGGTVYNG